MKEEGRPLAPLDSSFQFSLNVYHVFDVIYCRSVLSRAKKKAVYFVSIWIDTISSFSCCFECCMCIWFMYRIHMRFCFTNDNSYFKKNLQRICVHIHSSSWNWSKLNSKISFVWLQEDVKWSDDFSSLSYKENFVKWRKLEQLLSFENPFKEKLNLLTL